MGAYTSILVYILLVSGMALSKFIDNPETVPGKTSVEDIALLRKQVAVQSKELASQRKIIEKLENVVVKLVENNGMDITNMVEDFEINPKLKKKGFERNSSFDGRNENESLNEDFDVQGNMRQKRLAISGIQDGFTVFRRNGISLVSENVFIFEDVRTNVSSAYDNHVYAVY
ncbi:UBR1 [Mytilus edulis]|uniref:UBR1 n=1 Tax=Mytilus edulis TaxID=6550 RepID=A0A8S3TI92_MYTED|nr:UBR1 [Mytilus edulis]